jgi:hypothetical protein
MESTGFPNFQLIMLPECIVYFGQLKFESQRSSAPEKQDNLKSDNLQYNMLGHWVDHLIDQVSDGPSIILID